MTGLCSSSRTISFALASVLLGCGERTVAAGGDETGSADTDESSELLSCAGPNAPTEPVELVAGEMQPATFARVGERIYWADAWDQWADEQPSTTLYRADVGEDGEWVAVAVEQPGINEIVATDDAIYWVVEGLSESDGALLRASLDDEVMVLDEGLRTPKALTLGEANEWVYYAEGSLTGPNAKILRIRPDGSSKQVIYEGEGQIYDLAVDESHVWWVQPSAYEVWRVAKDGSGQEFLGEVAYPEEIEVHEGVGWVIGLTGLSRVSSGEEPYWIHGHGGPREIAADSSHVYLADRNQFEETHLGWVSRYPLSNGELDASDRAFVIDKAAPRPTSVQVDEHAVYWSTADEDSGQGAIWMLCKSAI